MNRKRIVHIMIAGLMVLHILTSDMGVWAQPATQEGNVARGLVKDAVSNKPLGGIRLSVEGISAAITDDQGRFEIRVPDYQAQLVVGGEGFESRVVHLKGRQQVNITLFDATHSNPYNMVNMPHGTIRQNDATTLPGVPDMKGSWAMPFETLDAQLQGRVAGLNVVRRSGTPGVGANMFMRGFTTLYGNNKPLLVIDGMIYDYNDYGESIIANTIMNPLALIDAKDIQDISVLRDASSVYGTRGANGAIIVTTIRAKEQATKIDFGVYTGLNTPPANMPVMDAGSYRNYLHDVLQTRGWSSTTINSLPYMDNDLKNPQYFATHNNTDWQRRVLNTSMNQNYYLKVTGGDNIATYALSMGFLKNEGVIKNTDLIRYNTRFNADLTFSPKFTGTANLSFSYNEQNLRDQGLARSTNPIFLGLIKAPFFTDREVNEIGLVSPNIADTDELGISNPTAVISSMQANNKYYRFFGSIGLKYAFSNKLNLSSLMGITFDKGRENLFVPRKGISNDTLSNAVIDSRMGTQVRRLYSLYNDTRLQYSVQNQRQGLQLNAGMRFQNSSASQTFALGFNSATDELVSVQNGVNALRQVGGGIGEWNWLNLYTSADYHFRHKYFVTIEGAVDASSRFGMQAQEGIKLNGVPFAIMPSIRAAWLLSNESFMQHSAISLLKLRVNAGRTGNDEIGNYSSRQTYQSLNLLGMQGLVRSGIANPQLQWENVMRTGVGIDAGFFNDRLQVNVDWYRNYTAKMLTYMPLQSITGFAQVLNNGGSMRTNGLDISVTARTVNTTNFKWDVMVNASTLSNKVLNVPGGSFTTDFAGATLLTASGQQAAQFFGLRTNGVFSTAAEAASSGLQRRMADGALVPFGAGDIRFVDLNGDRVIDDADRVVLGAAQPAWFGSFINKFYYKRFAVETVFTFAQGGSIFNYVRQQLESASGVENQLQRVANRWRGEGQVTHVPKAAWGDPMGNAAFSDRWIEDGSYLRLRTLSVDYRVPLQKQGFIKDLHIYAAANNLFTLTRYLGYDPEFSANPSVFAQGMDVAMEPIFKTFMTGVKIGL